MISIPVGSYFQNIFNVIQIIKHSLWRWREYSGCGVGGGGSGGDGVVNLVILRLLVVMV